jgi:hypothetical protein
MILIQFLKLKTSLSFYEMNAPKKQAARWSIKQSIKLKLDERKNYIHISLKYLYELVLKILKEKIYNLK